MKIKTSLYKRLPFLSKRTNRLLLSWILLIALIVGGGPAIKNLVVTHLPERIGILIGKHVLKQTLEANERVASNQPVYIYLDKIISRLKKSSNLPNTFTVHIIYNEDPNAFVLPSGDIIMHHSLIKLADSPEALAGILAHEMAHVTKKHQLNSIIVESGFVIFVKYLLGTDLYRMEDLFFNPYQQTQEIEADETAGDMLVKANIGTNALIAFCKKLPSETDHGFFSTHPFMQDRIDYLKKYTVANPGPKLLSPREWHSLKAYFEVPEFVP